MHPRLILGSQSPRRREILGFFTLPFEQMTPHFAEELVPFEGDPVAYVSKLAQGKAASLAPRFPKAVILTADTVVYKEGQVFNKPQNEAEALTMLEAFNGQWQSVFTGVTVQLGEKRWEGYEETKILFQQATPQELLLYHRAFHGKETAGGYAIQMAGSVIVKRMEGCFYNVMGLPVTTVCRLLKNVGIDLWHYLA